MEENKKGLLIIISGPSGAGKDSVINKIMEKRKDLKLSVSYTTRKPREGEVNGKDYHFVSKDEFIGIVNKGQMLEYALYCGNYYGTLDFRANKELEKGNNIILEIEVQGAELVIKEYPEAVSIFLVPPSIGELHKRLLKRGLDTSETVEKRVAEAKKEINLASHYNYIVVNDNINECVENIIKIIDTEYMKTSRMGYIINEVLKDEKIIC